MCSMLIDRMALVLRHFESIHTLFVHDKNISDDGGSILDSDGKPEPTCFQRPQASGSSDDRTRRSESVVSQAYQLM